MNDEVGRTPVKTKVAHKSVSMKSPRTSRSARFAAVTALAALVLAACGGSDAPQAAAPVAEAPAIPAPPPAPPVVSQLATLRSEFASSFGFDGDRLYWVESVPGQGPMIASMPRTGGTLVDHRSLDRPFPEPNGVTNWNVWHADTFFYAGESRGRIYKLADTPTPRVGGAYFGEAPLTWSDSASDLVLSGSYLYWTADSRAIARISTAGGAVTRLYQDPADSYSVRLVAVTQRWIYFVATVGGRFGLHRMPLEGGTPAFLSETYPSLLHEEGSGTLLLGEPTSGTLYRLDPTSGQTTQAAGPAQPAFMERVGLHVDGAWLYQLFNDGQGRCRLRRVALQGGAVEALYEGPRCTGLFADAGAVYWQVGTALMKATK